MSKKKTQAKLTADNFSIGDAYYELPNGKIARAISWHGGRNGDNPSVGYYFDDDKGGRVALEEEWSKWKRRLDLRDFPNARDPRLPYVFDLLWDIKYISDLKRALEQGEITTQDIQGVFIKKDDQELRALLKTHKISF